MEVPPLIKIADAGSSGASPQQQVQALVDAGRGGEAVEYLAHGLGASDSVWWATQSVEMVADELPPEEQAAAKAARKCVDVPDEARSNAGGAPGGGVALPEDLPEPLAREIETELAAAQTEAPPAAEPTPEGQAAADAAAASGMQGPGAWAAQAAAWASTGDPALPVAQAVFGAVMLAASVKAGQALPHTDPSTLETVDDPPADAAAADTAPPPPGAMEALKPFLAIGIAIASGQMVR
ncbi:MAG: hypothetical protein WD009_01325 [Phycisphaeraceae bacterium]